MSSVIPGRAATGHVPDPPGRPSTRLRGLVVAAIGAMSLLMAPSAMAQDPCPNAEFRTGPSASLPDCRAYEQVSPINKNGLAAQVGDNTQMGWASESGGLFTYFTAGAVNTEDAARSWPPVQRAERGTRRWHNEQAMNGPNPDSPIHAASSLARQVTPSADGSRLLFASGNGYTPDNPFVEAGGNGSVTISDGESNWWVSKPTWAGTVPAPGAAALTFEQFMSLGGSPDLSTVYFQSRALLTEADGDSGRTPLASWAVYRWADGELENAGVLPDGTLDPDGSTPAGIATTPGQGSANLGLQAASVNAYTNFVSLDGESVLFASPNPFGSSGRPAQLYVNREGQQSELLSKRPEEGGPLAGTTGLEPAGAISTHPSLAWSAPYAVASRDHNVVVFATADALTADAPVDASIKTYRLDRAAGDLTHIPAIDRPAGVRDGAVYGVSDDGSRILYRTQSGALELWRDGQPTRTLAASGADAGEIIEVRQADDGRTWFLVSTAPLGGEPDHPAGLSGQVYRYSEGSAGLACISCPAQHLSPRGPATFNLVGLANGITSGGHSSWGSLAPNRGITSDGRAAYFTSTSPLSPEDQNAVPDVYEWRDGRLSLLSSGALDSGGEMFLDNDPTGDSVFFTSHNQLAPTDTDDLGDVYVAGVGGGQPAPDPAPPTCQGDACQPLPAPPPALRPPAAPAAGPVAGEPKPVARLQVRRGRTTRRAIVVLVRAPAAGVIRVAGRRVRNVRRRTTGTDARKVRVRLSPAVRRVLRKRRVLGKRRAVKVPLRVRFRSTEGVSLTENVTVKVKIKRSRRAERKAR